MPAAIPLDEAVEDYLRHLKVERNLARNTLEAYGNDLRQLLEFLVDRQISTTSAITPPVLLEFLAALTRRGLTPRSQARRWIAARGLFRWLRTEQLIEIDPTQGIRMPKSGSKLP